MKFEHIKIKDLGPFREVDLDLAAISGKMIAVVGDDNGAGKSTLLELLPGALYRETATRGSLVDLATSREAFVEVRASNGAAHPWIIRQAVDAISGKGEALILDAGGEPQLSTTKLRDADAWVRAHFVAPEVLYTGAFLAQQSQGFLDLSAGERKQCLLRLLQGGIERLEAYAQSARERARKARWALDITRERLTEARQRYPDHKAAVAAQQTALRELELAVAERLKARAALDEAKQQEARIEQARRVEVQARALNVRINELTMRLADVDERIKNNRALLARAAEIKAAVAKLEQLEKTRHSADQLHAVAQATEQAERRAAAERALASDKAVKMHAQMLARVVAAKERCVDALGVARAIKALPAARAAVADAAKVCGDLEAQIEAAELLLVVGKDTRIKGLRGGLSSIAKSQTVGVPIGQIAQKTLTSDDALALKSKRAPAEIARMRTELKAALKDLAKATAKVEQLSAQTARDKDLKNAARDYDTLCAELAGLEDDAKVARGLAESAEQRRVEAVAAVRKAFSNGLKLAKQCEEQAAKCKHAPQLATATARLEEQLPVAAQLREQLAADTAALAALPVVEVPNVDVAALTAHLESWEQAERDARQQVTVCAEQVGAAIAGASITASLESDCAVAQLALENWTRLGQDCGREGIQAFEIDSALPELNTLANDLLHSCFGTRFTVELRSSRESHDGHRQLEDLVVHVIDSVKGFAGDASRYSGGQRVIIGEAIALALTMLACRIAGLSHPTLVRDESGAALTPKNARAYLIMLRRAAELIGADKVFFVTHNAELQALADARITVRDGTAVVTTEGMDGSQ